MNTPTQDQLLNAAIMLDGAHPAVAAWLVQKAEQQATEPNAILVEGFRRVALGKLNDLREKGYAINGVSIATISEAGETNRGAVTTGGMVLWWPQQPTEQAVEPVAGEVFKQFIEWASAAGYDVANTYDTDRSRWLCLNPMTAELWKAWQAVHNSIAGSAAPTQQAAEPAFHIKADALAMMAPPMLLLHGVTLYGYGAEGTVPVYTQQAAEPVAYSIDKDQEGIRAKVCDAVSGALAYGALGLNPAPEGHWLEPFWKMARAERDSRDSTLQPKFWYDEEDAVLYGLNEDRPNGCILLCTPAPTQQPLTDGRVIECAARLVAHADFQLGGVLGAHSKPKEIPSSAVSKVKARHLAALRDALAAHGITGSKT